MLSNTECYGRTGLQASSGEHLKALLGRTTDGLYKAMQAFDTTLARIRSGGYVPWTAPAGEMTLLHAQWTALLEWEWAVALTDTLTMTTDGNDIPDAAYSLVLKYCADAAKQSVMAMQIAGVVTGGKRPGNTSLETPELHINASLLEPSWTLLEVIYSRVRADMAWIKQLGISERFRVPYEVLEKAFRTKADVFVYYQDQWRVSPDVASRRQLLQNAMPMLAEFFKIGQQVWAPYLMGRDFVDVLRTAAVFEKYQLGIDPWSLTDPSVVTARSSDRESCVALAEFWKTIAEPRLAVALQNDISDAMLFGRVEVIPGRSYRIPPWHGQYRVIDTVTIGGVEYPAGTAIAVNFRGSAGQRVAEVRVTGKS